MLGSFSWQIIRDPARQYPCLSLLGPETGQWANMFRGSPACIPHLFWYQHTNFLLGNQLCPPLRPYIWTGWIQSILQEVEGMWPNQGTLLPLMQRLFQEWIQPAPRIGHEIFPQLLNTWETIRLVLPSPSCHHTGITVYKWSQEEEGKLCWREKPCPGYIS